MTVPRADAAWALEVSEITEHQMATLIQMPRDIYPHDRIGNEYYAIAVKAYDNPQAKEMVAEGVAALDALAVAAGATDYLSTG